MNYSKIRKSLERSQQSLDTMVTGLLTELVKGTRRRSNGDGHTKVNGPDNDELEGGPDAMGLKESVTKSLARPNRTPRWFEDTVLY